MIALVTVLASALVVALGFLLWVLFRKPISEFPTTAAANAPHPSAPEPIPIQKLPSPTVLNEVSMPISVPELRPPLLPPVILEEPADQHVLTHGVASFWIRAKGEGLRYQWQRNGQDIEGAIDPFYIAPDVNLDLDGGRFTVQVCNETGSVRSHEAVVRVQATRFITGDPQNPCIQISRWSQREKLGPEVQPNEQLKTLLGNLLEKAPGLATAGAMVGSSRLFVLRLSPEMMQAVASGTAEVQRAIGGGFRSNVVQGNHYIGHGAYFDVSNVVKVAGVALAVWQILAIITAQKFLADINRRLAGIEHGIQDLKEWLEEEAHSTLSSNYRYLCQIATTLNSQPLNLQESTTFLNQVEQIDRECAKLQYLFSQRSLAALEAFRIQEVQGLGLKENAKALQKHGLQNLQMHSGHLNALRVRCAAAQVRLALPANPELLKPRLVEIREALRESLAMQRIFTEISKDQLRRMKGRFSKDKTDKDERENVEKPMETAMTDLRTLTEELETGLSGLEETLGNVLDGYYNGLGLAVELGPGGEVLRVNHVAA